MHPVTSIPLYKANDYSVFKSLSGNRPISTTNVRRLAKTIISDPNFTRANPIRVNEHMEIIDGQHRVEAYRQYADKTGIHPDIFFFITEGATIEDARNLNGGSKPWAPIDYARAHAATGNRNYSQYLEFLDEHDVKHEVAAQYLAPKAIYDMDAFRRGEFKVESLMQAHRLMDMLKEVGVLTTENEEWSTRLYALTFLKIVQSPLYDHERMVEQAEQYGDSVKKIQVDKWERPSEVNKIARALQRIYNKKRERVELN